MGFTKRPIYFDGIDGIFDEKGSTFLALRKTQWCEQDEEPDPEKAKLELRKFRITSEGERADKGFSFLTEDGPHELVKVLVQEGFGNTKEIIQELKKRSNFRESIENLFDDTEEIDSNGEYFDMRSVLLDDSESKED